VYARWPANSTHSTQAKYTVIHAAGSTDVTVNQQLDGGEWVLLGTFSLTSANSKVKLVPSADGIVAADAVKAVNTSEASRIFFVHADHLNAPRVVMNSANQLRWRWISDPFGQLPPEENPQGLGAFALNLRLPGQLYDIESNLHYNYFRDYSPETGRYVQSDPIGLAGGINTYSYALNQPTRYTDPNGLTPAAALCLVPGVGWVSCGAAATGVVVVGGAWWLIQNALPKPTAPAYPSAANDEKFGDCPPPCDELRKQLETAYRAMVVVLINPTQDPLLKSRLEWRFRKLRKDYEALCGPWQPPSAPPEPPIDKIHDFYGR
jgi:RHS repeat-associated protein